MDQQSPSKPKTSAATWFLYACLGGMLLAAMIGYGTILMRSPFPEMSIHGWVAMFIGVLFSLLIGCGLMWLSFYSSRHGYDERADPGRHVRNGEE